MSQLRSYIDRGLTFVATVTRPDAAGVEQPIDLTQGGLKLQFTAKRRRSDADAAALVSKTQGAGISLNSPVTVPKNLATIQILAADLAALTDDATLFWDLVLTDPSSGLGAETIDSGVWRAIYPVRRTPA